jgi:hypothetical protein
MPPLIVSLVLCSLAGSLAVEAAANGSGSALSAASNGAKSAQLHEREFVSAQARIQLDCQRDKTVIKANFTKPFAGVLGVGNPETTKCKLVGTNERYYELKVNHNATDECNARWDNTTSSIANTLFIRFHQSLETGNDIIKNVLCRLSVGDLVVGRRPAAASSRARQQQRIIKAKRNE